MELRNAKVYQNEALDLILGIPEVYPFSKKLGLCPHHPCPEIEKIYKVFVVEKDIDARPRCIFYSISYISTKKFYYEEALPNKKDSQNLCLCEYTHPALVGFFNDGQTCAEREATIAQWKRESGDTNVEYAQRLLDNTVLG